MDSQTGQARAIYTMRTLYTVATPRHHMPSGYGIGLALASGGQRGPSCKRRYVHDIPSCPHRRSDQEERNHEPKRAAHVIVGNPVFLGALRAPGPQAAPSGWVSTRDNLNPGPCPPLEPNYPHPASEIGNHRAARLSYGDTIRSPRHMKAKLPRVFSGPAVVGSWLIYCHTVGVFGNRVTQLYVAVDDHRAGLVKAA